MEQKINSVADLKVFQKAHALTLEIYKATASFPQEEKFALTDQIRRAAASVGANIFEGGYRAGKNEFRHFVNIARGSAGEVKYFLLLSKDLGYITEKQFEHLNSDIDEITRMLYGLIKSLK